MEISGYLPEGPLGSAVAGGRIAGTLGLRRVWLGELAHDPFLPLGVLAHQFHDDPDAPALGTGVAIAFARSPWVIAQVAWDLAEASRGRFVLGLGTQVRSHVQRRFGARWESPVGWLRDYVGAVRAIWQSWSTGQRLRHDGPYFKLDLSAPRFTPDALTVPTPPIYLAGVNTALCRLAGEVADGFIVHGLNSPRYIREQVLPALRAATGSAQRAAPPRVVAPVLVGTGRDLDEARAQTRRMVAFYASTPSYRTILATHGWQELGERLRALAARQDWSAMTAAVDDEVLDAFAVCGPPHEVGTEIARRYTGIADEVALLHAVSPDEAETWRDILAGAASFDEVGALS